MPSAQSVPVAPVVSESRLKASAASSGSPLRTAASIELHQRPRGEQQLVCAVLLRREARLLVAAEAVVEQRARPRDDAQARSLAPGHQIGHPGLDQVREVGFAAPPGGERQRTVGREPAPGRLADRLRFVEQRSGGGELAGQPVHAHALVQGDVKQAEGAGITGHLEVVDAERLPALVVPHESGDVAGEPDPAQTLLPGDVVAAERAHRPLERRGRRPEPLGDQHGQAVPEEIRRARRPRRRRHGPRRLGDFQHTAAVGHATDDDRGPQRVEVGLACERDVERLEPLGGLEQQRRRVAAALAPRRRSARGGGPRGRAGARRAVRPAPWPAVRGPRRTRRPRARPAPRPARAARGAPVRASARSRARRKAAAAARPPRACARSAERSSSCATSSSGPGVACARCQARRSGSTSGSVASASTRCALWRSCTDAAR